MGNPVTFTMRSSRNSKPNLRYCLRAASISAIATVLLFIEMGLDAEPSSARLATLSGISYDQANRSVSIVLFLNDHRPFTLGTLDSGLYVDIENTRLSTELLANGTRLPSDRPVQVKTQQLRKDTARVVFQFDAIARLQAVQLKYPTRILVEIDLPDQPTETGDSLSASATPYPVNGKQDPVRSLCRFTDVRRGLISRCFPISYEAQEIGLGNRAQALIPPNA